MGFFNIFGKKSGTKAYTENKNQISNNARLCESLSNYADISNKFITYEGKNTSMDEVLDDIYNKLVFLNPSSNKEVCKIDDKINKCLLDIRQCLVESEFKKPYVENYVKNLINDIADRECKSFEK